MDCGADLLFDVLQNRGYLRIAALCDPGIQEYLHKGFSVRQRGLWDRKRQNGCEGDETPGQECQSQNPRALPPGHAENVGIAKGPQSPQTCAFRNDPSGYDGDGEKLNPDKQAVPP